MAVTYRFCVVDPGTWCDARAIEDVEECTVVFDRSLETKGKMTMTSSSLFDDSYVRVYIVIDGAEECLGTFLVQTDALKHDGRTGRRSYDGYTPLLELKEDMPPVGYFVVGGTAISRAAECARAHCRAPVSAAAGGSAIAQPIVAAEDDTWLSWMTALLAKDGHWPMVEPRGTVVFVPERTPASMQPAFSFADGAGSVVQGDIEDTVDYYGIPNTVEVIASEGDATFTAVAVNDDPGSPLSTASRGRTVLERVKDPPLPDGFGQEEVDDFARRTLAGLSAVAHTVVFTHKWQPHLAVGDCVRLDFERTGTHALAVVQRQEMDCDAGMLVKCTATYTEVV